jgi:hypothetical protein
MMSSTIDDPEDADWRAVLEALLELHRRLLDRAEDLRVTLGRPAACWDVQNGDSPSGRRLGPGRLEASERIALYERLTGDIHALEQMAGQLEQLAQSLPPPTPTEGHS